jgi:Spy/CpxP family protein refolding chaperone
MKRGILMQMSMCAMVMAGVGAMAFAQGPTTKPSGDSTLAGPKVDDSAPRGKDFGGGNKKQGEMGPLQKILKNLDLTAEQETKIKGLAKAHEEKMMQFHAENKVKMEDMKSVMEKAKASGDKAQMDSLMEQKRAMDKSRPKLEELVSQISDVLTPEQREKFKMQVQEHKRSLENRAGGKDGMKEMRQEKKEEKKMDKQDHKEIKQGGKDKLNLN